MQKNSENRPDDHWRDKQQALVCIAGRLVNIVYGMLKLHTIPGTGAIKTLDISDGIAYTESKKIRNSYFRTNKEMIVC